LMTEKHFKELSNFFDGIDDLRLSVPAEEIRFQRLQSKQVMAKVIAKHTPIMIEKSLVKLNKDVVKNLSSEANLTSRVWEALIDYLISRFDHYEDTLNLCYSSASSQAIPQLMSSKEVAQLIRTKILKETK